MPEYYHNLITEKSFSLLKEIRKKYDFILIGGWAVFLYTKSLKSKDIDIIIDYEHLERFKKDFEISKNERLSKYEAKKEEIDIDIYVPHFSKLGLLVEEIMKHTESIEGFIVPKPEMLLIMKIYTFSQRKDSNKGKKDALDIFSLIKNRINWKTYQDLIKQYNLSNLNKELKDLLNSFVRVPELDLSDHQLARLKKRVLTNILN